MVGELAIGRISRRLDFEGVLELAEGLGSLSSVDGYSQLDMPI
jgi:hypothetical protein